MTSEFGKMSAVIVTPEMLEHYFSMTKTEILAHLFLLSVCDNNRHIKRNARALARETERWHASVSSAIMGLKLKKMLEEKQLKTKGGSRYWRVYPLPRTREDKSKPVQQRSEGTAKKDAGAALNQPTGADNSRKGFLRRALEKMIRLALESSG